MAQDTQLMACRLPGLLSCLLPAAAFPGDPLVPPLACQHQHACRYRPSRQTLQTAANVQQLQRVPQQGKKPRKAGTPVLPLFSHGPLSNHLPGLSTGDCADSRTQRQR